jgi:type II secretory pathway pseudopilin PulG
MLRLRRTRHRIASRLACERGFTLVELLVAIASGVIVVGGAVLFMVVSFRQQNSISSRAIASSQAQAGLTQLVRDLREAMTSVSVSSSGTTTSVSFQIPTQGNVAVGQAVTWTCPNTSATTAGTCTRNLAGTTKTEINGVQSMAFTPYDSSSPPAALALPVSNATCATGSPCVSALAMTLTVQVTEYTLHPNGVAGNTPVPGTSNAPIVLQALTDLRNFA